ncbi:hypothetical protein DSC45_29840 [Streptomyces sp. YIM 130001]|uniref:hypothetical protein n=1 Tax=Streptomyces sp. YIM 130001 TaxID=2259644 RepID=UPI000E64D0A5|nr:hypothetical protein [Streptomyces sp. YIM 130001]RII09711.1 hypothetical protein DSC45_29840 [Streptomyces sp. YIM 130001]
MPSMREGGRNADDRSEPVPHDLPDQQAGTEADGPDHWDVPDAEEPDPKTPNDDVPDTDEAGTRRRGESAPETTAPEPQESPG